MRLDFSELGAAEGYRWLTATVTPRPIAWVSTRSPEGIDNLAPFSFFQVVCDDPPTLMISIGRRDDGGLKDTLVNARETGELVVQLVSHAQAAAMNASSANLPRGVSEFERCGIAAVASEQVKPLRVAGAPVAFECRVAEIKPYPAGRPTHHLVFAEVLLAHIDDGVLADARHADPARLDLVGRMGGSLYATTRDTFSMVRPKQPGPLPEFLK
ncbi:flavin reductase family protein [Pseudoxanthomonas wuyuanensis]